MSHVIPPGPGGPGIKRVCRLTSLDDNVFVLRYPSHGKIDVYDATNFILQRHITVPEVGRFWFGLAACPHNNCLYASDWDNDSVHKVELSGSNAVMKWSVARGPGGLSLNSQHDLLVLSRKEKTLQIFRTNGTLIQNIQLQADIEHPWHAVQLPTGKFLVSHWGSLHRVCLVGVDGAVVRSFGGQKGSQLTEMNEPEGLAVDRQGRVLVADGFNNRLLVIDQTLTIGREMSVRVDGG